ncbi:MAG TPA: hypothetical protein VHC68_01980 [Candidatus Paceibacterota bacterium]|nr:hypothetical protein [Candidatus Paceibacterota bacterium]
MNDRSLTNTPEPEVLPLTVHGYTLPRKIAIWFWLLLTLVSIAMTYRLFSLIEGGYDSFAHVSVIFLSNMNAGSYQPSYIFDLPLTGPARLLGLLLSAYCGMKTLLKLCIPPPIKTRRVIIHHFPGKEA